MMQLVFDFEDRIRHIEDAIDQKFFELGFKPDDLYVCEDIQRLSQSYFKHTGNYYRRVHNGLK